jgi:phospholipase/carboxylesterase
MLSENINRRKFARTITAGLSVCGLTRTLAAQKLTARLTAKPGASGASSTGPGLHNLGLRNDRDALLYIPESAAKRDKAPLVVSLHGATRNADRGISLLQSLSDEHGFVLLAPASEDRTWDAIGGNWGPDVEFINRSLARTFEMRKIDPGRIAMAGFSDGASYSLSIGLANGDLFHAVFGFSPGFIVREQWLGKPPVFISHGTIDPILPIDQCSRLIVPVLKRAGYRVTYREFEGKHTLPPEVASEAMRWLMAAPAISA